MLCITILFIFILKNKLNQRNDFTINSKIQKDNIESINITHDDIELMQNISANFYKLKLLNKLTNDKISEIMKLDLIKQYQLLENYNVIFSSNILAGGLLKDCDFIDDIK